VLALDLMVAWRVLVSVKLGRILPQLPASVLYSTDELEVLQAATQKKKPRLNAAATMTLSEANRRVARLGGYMARKGDGEPGAESLGLGLRRLTDLTWGWRLRRQAKQAAR
jgi:hypothetical protein